MPGFLVDDIVEAREELEAAGIEIVEPVRWMAEVNPRWSRQTRRLSTTDGLRFAPPTAMSTGASKGHLRSDRHPPRTVLGSRPWKTTSSL